ncbi:MAG: response regulator [Flammeovirgaceae bacterium]
MNTIPLSTWVVDDDPTYQEMLLSYLTLLGHRTRGFFSGEECLKHLSEKPDVIILDHNLGNGLQGLDVLRNIKHENKATSVIYISAEEKASLVSDAYSLGSDEYIGKDSASLLRLKLRLEKIADVKHLNAVKAEKRRKLLTVLILLGSLVTAILLCLLLLT